MKSTRKCPRDECDQHPKTVFLFVAAHSRATQFPRCSRWSYVEALPVNSCEEKEEILATVRF